MQPSLFAVPIEEGSTCSVGNRNHPWHTLGHECMPFSLGAGLTCILIVVFPDPRLPKKIYVVSATTACCSLAYTMLVELLPERYLTDGSLASQSVHTKNCHRETFSQQFYP